jgi:serine O-acetyltransferase
LFENLREDYRRCVPPDDGYPRWRVALNALGEYGFLAICVYRYGRWARGLKPRILSYPFKFVYIILRTMINILFGINISVNAEIGPGFYIGHFSCVFINGKLGSNCSVSQGVTIGGKGAGKTQGRPVIGNNVYIGAGGKVIGEVRVGNDVVIGANAVVVKDVPDRMLVVGGPMRVLPIAAAGPRSTDARV